MFHLNSLGEICFVQPASRQSESVCHAKTAAAVTAAAEKLEQQRVRKRLPVWIWRWVYKTSLWGMWNTPVYKWVSASCFANCVYPVVTRNCDVLPYERALGVGKVWETCFYPLEFIKKSWNVGFSGKKTSVWSFGCRPWESAKRETREANLHFQHAYKIFMWTNMKDPKLSWQDEFLVSQMLFSLLNTKKKKECKT